MIFYWVIFLLPAFFILIDRKVGRKGSGVFWVFIGAFFVLAVGLRHQVGGDWPHYLEHFERAKYLNFLDVFGGGDPGYYLINFVSAKIGASIHLVNLVCAFILVVGVCRFCRAQPEPWLALLVAVPYLIIVVAMGYTRQSAALGFVFLGLVSLQFKQVRHFAFWVILGATFHKSAVLLLPVAALAASRKRIWNMIWIAVITLMAFYLFLLESASHLWQNYVVADYDSQGGVVRVFMNAVPAFIFLCLRSYLHVPEEEKRLWTWMCIFAIACVPLVFLSSTATDRVALYLIPVQMYVFSRLHLATADRYLRACIVVAIILYYALVQLVWLLFATHAHLWLPYQMYPFVS